MKSNKKIPIMAYLELTKPRISSLVLVTTLIGFFLGGRGIHSTELLFYTLFGALLTCAGASALNHYLERDSDRKMFRTQNRPIPKGIISPAKALIYGVVLVLFGVVVLYVKVNLLTAFLSLLTAFLYVLVYTPMKKLTWLNTTIGAIPGALPPMGGWAAATNEISLGSWVLFLILFVWQHPHFYAIALMFKDDYKRGGFKMLPVIDETNKKTFIHIVAFSILLVPASLLPTVIGMSGKLYLYGAMLLSLTLLLIGLSLSASRSLQDARKLLRATVVYLPLLLFLIILDVSF